jgi:hypothetical protein
MRTKRNGQAQQQARDGAHKEKTENTKSGGLCDNHFVTFTQKPKRKEAIKVAISCEVFDWFLQE